MLSRARAVRSILPARLVPKVAMRFSTPAAPATPKADVQTISIGDNVTDAELQALVTKYTVTNIDDHMPKIPEEFLETESNFTAADTQYSIFNPDPQLTVSKRLVGIFGTMEAPTKVFSPKPYRIVGCVGPHDNDHELAWFTMEGYLKHMCPHCGQIFQLTTNPDEVTTDYIPKVDNMTHFG